MSDEVEKSMSDDLNQPSGIETDSSGLSRRQFLLGSATTAAGAVLWAGCAPPPAAEFEAQSRLRVSEDVLTGFENWYATGCQQCDAGCGVIVRVIEGRSKKVEGNPDHPVNRGKVCARGLASVQEQYHPDRITSPMRQTGPRGRGVFSPISWNEAIDTLVSRLRGIQQSGRTRDVAFLTTPLRAHRALIADRFTRSYGAEWLTLDTVNDAAFREAARRVFGGNSLPEFDIQNARYIISFGADFLGNWLSPVHYQNQYGVFRQGSYRLGQFQPRQGRPRGYMVHISSRFSPTAANADEWIYVPPGTETLVALAIAQIIMSENLGDAAGAQAIGGARSLDAYTPDRVFQETGVSADRIRKVAREFASQRPGLVIGGGSAGAQTNGADALTAILSLNTLVGNVGRPGGVLMNPAPAIDGLPSPAAPSRMSDWQGLADRVRGGQSQAVLLHDVNPVHDLPSALRFREALMSAPFIASFSSFMDETTQLSDLILPSHLPLEDWGDDIPDPGPGYQVYTIQQPVVRPLYDTRSIWDVLLTAGSELGGSVAQALPWESMKDALREDARGLQAQNRGSVQDADFERFWLKLVQQGGWWDTGRTANSTGTSSIQGFPSNPQPAQFDGDNSYPYFLVVFPHHTLGTGEAAHLPWLQGTPDPITTMAWQTWVEMNPDDAQRKGISEGDIVAIESRDGGRIEVPVYVSPAASPTVLSVPLGQGHNSYGRWATRDGGVRGANPMDLLAPITDQATGALAYGATKVKLSKTGRHISVAKFEGQVIAYQLPDEPVVQVTRGLES